MIPSIQNVITKDNKGLNSRSCDVGLLHDKLWVKCWDIIKCRIPIERVLLLGLALAIVSFCAGLVGSVNRPTNNMHCIR